MCGNMVHIQCATGEIRQGKKEQEERRDHRTKNNVRICYAARS